MLLHGSRAIAKAGVAVTTQVGHDQPIASRQKFSDGKPEFATNRKGVQQDYSWATACDVKTDFCVTAGDAFHAEDRKSTRLNSSHPSISYAVFCLKKKKNSQKRNIHIII